VCNFNRRLQKKGVDSLRNFITNYSKLCDDYINDVVNYLKDTMDMDTSHFLRPSTLSELKGFTTQCGIDYYNFLKKIKITAIVEQKKLLYIKKATINSKETTDLFCNKICLKLNKEDSIRQIFYNRMFVAKK
jgi:hypothetical protein